MSLNKSTLHTELSKFFDSESPNFTGMPQTFKESAEKWSNAINTYAKEIEVGSTTSEIAKKTFKFTYMLGQAPNAMIVILPLCFQQYAIMLSMGVSRSYISVPPILPLILQPAFMLGLAGMKSGVVLDKIVDLIDLWFRTGFTINIESGKFEFWK